VDIISNHREKERGGGHTLQHTREKARENPKTRNTN